MKKVLVAEDEESIREFIVINLTRSGYTVEQAENGAVALEKFAKDESGFDVAILDIMMPEVDGLAVCKQLRAKSSDLGIIMLSAKTQEMDKITGLMFGADDYVTKPFSPSELMARVDAVYRRVEMTRGFRKNDTTGDTVVLDEFELFERVERLTPEVLRSVKGEEKVVCANVDLFSGLVYKMMGIPMELYTPLFAVARMVGWCAHRIEEVCQPANRIIRPAYKAVAPMRAFVPLDQR